MTTAADAISAVIAGQRGDRPFSLDSQEAEQVLSVALALMVELAASNDRIDRLEREVAALRGVPLDDLRNAPLDDAARTERQDALDAMQLRVMRIFLDPRTGGERTAP